MKTGETIILGNYAGEPIQWQVIAEKDGAFLLLSRKVLEIRPLHPVDESEKQNPAEGYYETDWESCELRQWLNGEFAAAAFSGEELAHIPSTSVTFTRIYKTLYSFFRGESTAEDRIFLLSEDQMKKYLPSEADRAAILTDHAKAQLKACPHRAWGSWWLCESVHYGYGAHCRYVNNCVWNEKFLGTTLGEAAVWSNDVGIRPALWYKP